MKTKKLINIMLVVMASIAIFSCVENDDYDIPQINIEEPVINGTIIDVNEVRNAYLQAQSAGENFITFQETNNYVSGYVVSSDEAGNFFKELFIQNAPENPTAGVKILINVASLFGTYDIGRKVYVKLDGLSVGVDSGVITIGTITNNEIDRIPAPLEGEFIQRSSEVASIVPQSLTLSELTENHVGTLINLPKAQITQDQLSLSYANELGEEFDGERTIESCSDDGGSIILSTSSFADFKTSTVPSDAGSITAVLAKDFFGEQLVLLIRDTEDIDFQEARCEPQFLDPGIESTTTFIAIRNRFETDGYTEFAEDENLIIEGYVNSSDEAGNLYKEMYIQNTYLDSDINDTDPRLGFRISLDRQDLYQEFHVGQKVYVKLAGLAIGMEDGVLSLGYPNVSEIQQIADGLVDQFIIPGQELETLVPSVKTVSELTENDLGTLIKLVNTQFHRDEIGLTYAGEPTDDFDGERLMESCGDDSGSIRLFTSTFSNFKSLPLPEPSGEITAIYTTDYSGNENILIIRDTDDLIMDGERCDPIELSCGIASDQGTNNIFSDDFETQTPFSLVTGNGWTNYIQSGTEGWEAYTATGTNSSQGISVRAGSYQSGDDSTIAWLISPAIDLDAQDNETFTYETSNSFSDGSEMEVLFSNDWDGTEAGVETANWGVISDAHIVQDTDFYGNWISSGIVDLSCGEGTIYIAFKYIGSGDAGFDGTFELDNISIDYN